MFLRILSKAARTWWWWPTASPSVTRPAPARRSSVDWSPPASRRCCTAQTTVASDFRRRLCAIAEPLPLVEEPGDISVVSQSGAVVSSGHRRHPRRRRRPGLVRVAGQPSAAVRRGPRHRLPASVAAPG